MEGRLYAHIRDENGTPIYQSLEVHCRKTAEYAAAALQGVHLSAAGELAGLLHDAGKASAAFQTYLYDAAVAGKPVRRGSVNHTSAGCRYFLEHYHSSGELDEAALAAELLAYACGAHHGLFDCMDKSRGFTYRRSDPNIEYTAVLSVLGTQEADLHERFDEAVTEISVAMKRIGAMCEERDADEADFYFGLLSKLLLSAVIEGDRRDTAEFMNGKEYPSAAVESTVWEACVQYMEEKLSRLDNTTPINRARRAISDRCAAFASHPGGVIRLNVPTGAGKTLAALRYALRHAASRGKTRIIFTSSLLSVLDQNAQVIRDHLPDSRMILEHHSNIVQVEETDEREEWEMMIEAWRTPVVITTLVQLLNTLFLKRTSNIRRFHALCNAVLVIDEVQTVPNELLTLFNLAVNFLTELCGTTVVLCSATQPCLEQADHPLLREPQDMVPFDADLWSVFRRTELRQIEARSLEEMPELALEILSKRQSLLIVCNKKSEAEKLFRLCSSVNAAVYHLSAGMCMQHRRDALRELQQALSCGKRVLCVSTQVIEAGVDISFAAVVRLCAGMDSIVQAAGRCNRNGESRKLAPVYIVECIGESLGKLPSIKAGQTATRSLLYAAEQTPERFRHDLTSDDAIRYYFKALYRQMKSGFQDGTVEVPGGRTAALYSLLSSNLTGDPDEENYAMHQAFRTAGECFSVFQTDTIEVVVPYGEGRRLCAALQAADNSYVTDYQAISALLRQAKPYTVSLYRWQREQLNKKGALMPLFDGRVTLLSDGFYNEQTGFTMDETLWEV